VKKSIVCKKNIDSVLIENFPFHSQMFSVLHSEDFWKQIKPQWFDGVTPPKRNTSLLARQGQLKGIVWTSSADKQFG
jgi:hypothetical protein